MHSSPVRFCSIVSRPMYLLRDGTHLPIFYHKLRTWLVEVSPRGTMNLKELQHTQKNKKKESRKVFREFFQVDEF